MVSSSSPLRRHAAFPSAQCDGPVLWRKSASTPLRSVTHQPCAAYERPILRCSVDCIIWAGGRCALDCRRTNWLPPPAGDTIQGHGRPTDLLSSREVRRNYHGICDATKLQASGQQQVDIPRWPHFPCGVHATQLAAHDLLQRAGEGPLRQHDFKPRLPFWALSGRPPSTTQPCGISKRSAFLLFFCLSLFV